MDILLKELNLKGLKVQSLVLPNRPVQTPEEWQFDIKEKLSKLRLG